MSKKLYALINGIVDGVAVITSAVVAYVNPAYTPAIVAAIGIGASAINEICLLFVDTESK